MTFSHARTPAQSLSEYGRGVAGGLVFSLPLLFTVEVWDAAITLSPLRLLAWLGLTFALLLLYNRFAGLRKEATWLECAIDSVEELGLGIVISAFVLWILGRFEGAAFNEIFSKTVMEAMTVAIGVSVGTAQLGESENTSSDSPGDEAPDDESNDAHGQNFWSQLAITLCGAVLFVNNVAPTDEILQLAVEVAFWKLFLIAILCLVCGAYLLFYAEFRGANRISRPQSAPMLVRDAVLNYAVALLAAALMLFFFGRFENESFQTIVTQTVIAGIPATLGASVGRLLLQVNSDG